MKGKTFNMDLINSLEYTISGLIRMQQLIMERQELIKAGILVRTKFGFKLVRSYFFKQIHVYYLNKSHNPLKCHMTKTTHGWYLQSNSHQGLEQDSSKPI